MAGIIGTLACSFLRGYSGPLRERLTRWNIPGIDGTGVHLLGRVGLDSRLTAIIISTRPGARLWYDTLASMTGTIVNITNDEGNTMTSQLIVEVSQARITTAHDLNFARVRYEVTVTCQTQF